MCNVNDVLTSTEKINCSNLVYRFHGSYANETIHLSHIEIGLVPRNAGADDEVFDPICYEYSTDVAKDRCVCITERTLMHWEPFLTFFVTPWFFPLHALVRSG